MAGRATLISSVLASIPNFYMQTMWLPSSVHKEIDRISNNFLWGSTNHQRKIHSIGWDTVCLPKNKGGLGFRSARNANIVSMSKLNWRLHTEKDKAWREVLVRKYNINNFSFAPSLSASPVIQCISKGTELFKSGIKYIPRNGHSISFWFDHWVGAAPLRSFLFGPLIENAESILLSDALSNGAINMDAIGYTLPSDLVREILAIPLSNLPSIADGFSWQGKSNGIFSTAFAYRNLIPIFTQLPLDWNWIWTTPTLPKIQMFLWQLAHGRIKTLEFLHHIGIVDDAVCKICKRQTESIEHIFRSCPPTASTLHKLSPHLTNHNDSDFESWLRHHSQNMSPSPIFNIPWAIIFCFAIWVIWNQRNLVLNKGDVFVFLIGMIDFLLNEGKTPAVAFAALSSRNPGVITIANFVFGSNPPINPDVLTNGFTSDKNVVQYLQSKF
ncbi:hypothetical protein SLE2022_036770 [Rubroshorea leprosula]